jgi:hypothetical protein
MLALMRAGWAWACLAGLLLAATINIRPIYIASVPGCLWLLLQIPTPLPGGRRWLRLASLVAGAALVLLPQWRINQHHFRQKSPLVLTGLPGSRPLYLKQLTWGTGFQRYESSLVPESPRSLVYADPWGQWALKIEPNGIFPSYGYYFGFVVQRPLETAWRYFRHLFNGLDIWFPTPYPTQLHPPGQAALRLLNYALLGLGAWLAVTAAWRPRTSSRGVSRTSAAVLLALLLPCALVLPTLMECRFLLPLHLLVLTTVAASWQPAAWWRELGGPVRRLAVLGLAAGWLWGCWHLSEDTARQLRPPSEAPQE